MPATALSGYTSTLPAATLLNPALIKIGSVILGVTRDSPAWDPEIEIADIAFDGLRAKHVKGLSRIAKRGGKLSGTILELATAPQIQKLEPGASTATGGTGVTSIITPKSAGVLFADGDYLADVRAIWSLGGGNYFAIYIPCALNVKYDIKGGDSGEGTGTFEFDAVLDLSAVGATIGDAPYKYELRTALP